MKSLKLLGLAMPLLLVVLLPAFAADEPPTEKMETNEYFPLKIGTVWHYTLGNAGNKFQVKASKEEKFEGKSSVKLEMLGAGGKPESFENIAVTKDGVYRLGFEGSKAEPPVKMLQLPVKDGDKWEIDSKIGKESLKGTWKVGKEEKVKVPAGEFDAITVSTENTEANGTKLSFTSYYAKGKGLIKQVIKIGANEVVIELDKIEEPTK